MRIEEGKYYRTRDGRKVGPMFREDHYRLSSEAGTWYESSGNSSGRNHVYELDIVSEWTDGPVRTIERKEIVPGVYGRIEVMKPLNDKAVIGIVNLTHGVADFGVDLTADELDSAAAVLTALAGALRDGE